MSVLKRIATDYDDVELFKVACELEKNSGIMSAIRTGGEQIAEALPKWKPVLNSDVSDIAKHVASKLTTPAVKQIQKPSFYSKLSPGAKMRFDSAHS